MIFSSNFLLVITFSHVLHLDVLRRQIELKLKVKTEISLCMAIMQNHPLPSLYGYFPNAAKTWLLTKPEYLSRAKSEFDNIKVNVTCEGRPHLGAALGTQEYMDKFVEGKVDNWCAELELLSFIAKTQPHAAYAAYTHGMTSK